MPSGSTLACERCRFCWGGECRRRAPRSPGRLKWSPLAVAYQLERGAMWPEVQPADFCFEYSPIPAAAD